MFTFFLRHTKIHCITETRGLGNSTISLRIKNICSRLGFCDKKKESFFSQSQNCYWQTVTKSSKVIVEVVQKRKSPIGIIIQWSFIHFDMQNGFSFNSQWFCYQVYACLFNLNGFLAMVFSAFRVVVFFILLCQSVVTSTT